MGPANSMGLELTAAWENLTAPRDARAQAHARSVHTSGGGGGAGSPAVP